MALIGVRELREQATEVIRKVREELVPLDLSLVDEACRLGAEQRPRDADAVYAAVAQHYRTTLVTTDRQQLDRLLSIMKVKKPAEILSET